MQKPESAPLALIVTELGQRGVQARARRSRYNRDSIAEPEECDRMHPLAAKHRIRPNQGPETERIAQNRLKEALGERAGLAARGAARLHLLEARLGDAPAPRDLVADLESLWNAVVGRLLRGGLESGDLAEPLRSEKAAFD